MRAQSGRTGVGAGSQASKSSKKMALSEGAYSRAKKSEKAATARRKAASARRGKK